MGRMEIDQTVTQLLSLPTASEPALEKVGSSAGILGDFSMKTMLGAGGMVKRLRAFLWLQTVRHPLLDLAGTCIHVHIHSLSLSLCPILNFSPFL